MIGVLRDKQNALQDPRLRQVDALGRARGVATEMVRASVEEQVRVLGQPLSTYDLGVRQRLFRAFLDGMLCLTRREVRAVIALAPPPLPRLTDTLAPLPRRRQRRAAEAPASRDDAVGAPIDGAAGDARAATSSATNARRSVAGSWPRSDGDATVTSA